MKYFRKSLGILLLCGIVFLGACGNTGGNKSEKKKGEVSSKVVSMQIVDGTYVIPEKETVTEDTGYLALNIKIKNKGKETLSLSPDEINLYDEDDNKIAQKNIYNEDENFKQIKFESISGGKSTNGYVIFKVDKDKKYELHYAPVSFLGDKKKDIKVAVESKDYPDNSEEVQKLVEGFVDTVFLNKQVEKAAENLTNNLGEEQQTFSKEFRQVLNEQFYDYKPSEAELETAVKAFESANAKKAKISYSFKEFYPKSAIVYVKPETIHFDSIDLTGIVSEFVDKNEGKYSDYDKAQTDAEKYVLEQLPAKFESASTNTNDYSSGEGYEVRLTKNSDKWTIDTADNSNNHSFKYLKQAFMGDLYL
ncbi:DUF4352 domain-containing protein [Enterococcus faecalis]|uniref:DUF4352 domain-containing protein n=1 Tax=Enterococcus faecalis TaxID=1351 RepID=UPI000BBB5B44|nr:DUF4352 domain-containing protein [Enterococcus faecalis]